MKSIFTKKKKLEIPLPEGWHDVSFNTGLQIVSDPELDNIKVLSLVSGVSVDKLRKSTDLETIHYLLSSLLFLKSLPIKKNPEFPSKVNGAELPWVNYADRFDLGKATAGQVEDMQQVIKDTNAKTEIEVVQMYPKLCAIYLQPILTVSDYDYDQAINMQEEIEKIDFKTIVNMGSFFLLRSSVLTNGLLKGWRNHRSPMRRLKLASKNLVQRLVSTLR